MVVPDNDVQEVVWMAEVGAQPQDGRVQRWRDPLNDGQRVLRALQIDIVCVCFRHEEVRQQLLHHVLQRLLLS